MSIHMFARMVTATGLCSSRTWVAPPLVVRRAPLTTPSDTTSPVDLCENLQGTPGNSIVLRSLNRASLEPAEQGKPPFSAHWKKHAAADSLAKEVCDLLCISFEAEALNLI